MKRSIFIACAITACIALSGCAPWDGPQRTLEASGPADASDGTGLIAVFRSAYRSSTDDPSNPDKAAAFQAAGMVLVQSHCDDFFFNIGRVRQRTNIFQRGLALGGATFAAVGGLTGIGAKAIALAVAGITGVIGTSEILTDELLFGPDVDAVHQLIAMELGTYNNSVWQQNQPLSYYTAHSNVQGAQNICQVHHIRARVNEAVRAGRFTRDVNSEQDAIRQACDVMRSRRVIPPAELNCPISPTPPTAPTHAPAAPAAPAAAGTPAVAPPLAVPALQSRPVLRIQ